MMNNRMPFALTWHRRALLWVIVAAWVPIGVDAQESVPVANQAELLLKAMSYDKNLLKRSGDGIRIAVVHRDADDDAAKLVKAFGVAGKDKVSGLAVNASAVPFSNVEDLLKQVDSNGHNVLYVHASTTTALSSIQQVTRGKKLLSVGGSKQLVEQGVSLGVYMKKSVPRLVVNQRSAKVEGLDLKPAIKLISTVVK
jgi:hypothetical protein